MLPQTVPADGALEVCLEVPICSADASAPEAALVIAAVEAPFDDQKVQAPLSWTVSGRSWVDCNGFWLWPSVGGLVALLVAVGFIRPVRFPAGAHVRTAGSLKGLKRAASSELRSCPGAGAGFYRDARLGLHGDGSVNGRVRGALALLRATRRGVVLQPRGGLEVYDKRRRRWEPAELRSGAYEPSPSETYRIGDLFFQIEPG